jgi:hypothetical protein
MKTVGTYFIAGLYFLFGIWLPFVISAFSEVYASIYGDHWRPEQNPLIAPFFWPAYVWTLFFGICALLLCFTVRLPPKTRKRVNIGAWLVFFILVLHILDWVYGFTFHYQWHMLPTWKLINW